MSCSLQDTLLVSSPRFGSLLRDNHSLTENNNNNNNNNNLLGNEKIQEIWNKHTFKVGPSLNLKEMKVNGWTQDEKFEPQEELNPNSESTMAEEPVREDESSQEPLDDGKDDQNGSPSHHARRPMNAFLIFCKKHRPIVRDRFPNLENRGVTKILGEWWSLLEEPDKAPFTNLANEYKDAFFSANPDFKWYKLPAPPLRTLLVRPSNAAPKLPSPQSITSQTNQQIFNEFTPGKLADESQLGSLTSLLNNNFPSVGSKIADCCSNRFEKTTSPTMEMGENNNEIEKCDNTLKSPVNLMRAAVLPPKPIKKRIFSQYLASNTKDETDFILKMDCNESDNYYDIVQDHRSEDSVTNQDIVDKVVDNLFVDKEAMELEMKRKSGRQCKGKRYEKFMFEGKLLGNKRDTRLTQNKSPNVAKEPTSPVTESKPEITTPNLENTIKRLAERTKVTIIKNEDDTLIVVPKEDDADPETPEPVTSTNFNLDSKIGNLPSLSYDAFVQKKRESKKRKLRRVSSGGDKSARREEVPVGSKKRKNKHSITHLETKEKNDFDDLLGLATLAEVAANTQKINETLLL